LRKWSPDEKVRQTLNYANKAENLSNINHDDSYFKKNVINQSENQINLSISKADHLQLTPERPKEILVLQAELMKYAKSGQYFGKYCVLTTNEFRYYKSMESYFRLSNPLYKINISSVNSCEVMKKDKTFKQKKGDNLFYMSIKLNEAVEASYQDLLKSGVTNDSTVRRNIESDRKPRTMALIDPGKEPNLLTVSRIRQSQIGNNETENILIFASAKEEEIKSWVKEINNLLHR